LPLASISSLSALVNHPLHLPAISFQAFRLEFKMLSQRSCPKNQGLTQTELNSVVLVRERTMSTEQRPLVGVVVPTFADRGCCVVSATDSHGR
jgi:hypothetical protein